MKLLLAAMIAALVSVSSLAHAESGGDRAFSQAMRQNEKAMALYAESQGKTLPVVRDYHYGMKLDIAKVVSITPPIQSCSVVPSRMTYEDSSGQLNTLEYSVMGDCRLNGG